MKLLRNNVVVYLAASLVFLLSISALIISFTAKKMYVETFLPLPQDMIIIVLDAGHGGADPGCVSEGLKESDINLVIERKIKERLLKKGFFVVETRCGDDGLYFGASTVWDKDQDMLKRKEIINSCAASLFLTIHQNSFSDSSVKGAQVFYNSKHADNEALANNMQISVASAATYENKRQALENNDYYLLKNSPCPAVLIECGFLTNETDRALLTDEIYLDKFADAVCKTVCVYFKVQY